MEEENHFLVCLIRWLTTQLPMPNLSELKVVSRSQIVLLQGKQKRRDWLHRAMIQECLAVNLIRGLCKSRKVHKESTYLTAV